VRMVVFLREFRGRMPAVDPDPGIGAGAQQPKCCFLVALYGSHHERRIDIRGAVLGVGVYARAAFDEEADDMIVSLVCGISEGV